MMKFLMIVFTLMFAVSQPSQAAWQDDEALATARVELAAWEARLVKAVANPEMQLVRIDENKATPAPSAATIDPIIVENTTIVRSQKEARKPKPGEPVFKRVRNFVRYLAKVEYTHQQLQTARKNYANALTVMQEKDRDFNDVDYKKTLGVDDAERAWLEVVNEVGRDAINEASAAYKGEDVLLKSLTD